jgi:hypothetical protein
MSITTDNTKTNHAQPNVKGVEGFFQFFGLDEFKIRGQTIVCNNCPPALRGSFAVFTRRSARLMREVGSGSSRLG